MTALQTYGMTEREMRAALEWELGRSESTTSFYWESEELEETLDLVIEAVAIVIAENNKKLSDEYSATSSRMSGAPRGPVLLREPTG